MKERCIQPELLDALPASDPRAIGSRRDLCRINAWMGNARLVAGGLGGALRRSTPRRIVDLGAGDGSFLLRWVRGLPNLSRDVEVVLVDRWDAVDGQVLVELGTLGWPARVVRTEALEWLETVAAEPGTWVVANLFLHHFAEEGLRRLLGQVAEKAELCCACEPRRGWWPLAASRLVGLIGANAVTRHDARASVRAGFRHRELCDLWPRVPGWRLHEQAAGLFSHLFLAERA